MKKLVYQVLEILGGLLVVAGGFIFFGGVMAIITPRRYELRTGSPPDISTLIGFLFAIGVMAFGVFGFRFARRRREVSENNPMPLPKKCQELSDGK